ncbi:MAG: hypothetical protein RLZZ292_1141 [Bacteroidota bacterium]|jgi:exonuclease SbcD
MRFLHTADWHLGQRFLITQDREEELGHALDWLLTTIQQEKIDVLLVAGDVFDTNSPPASAQKLYYQFLFRLMQTACRHAVIIGGNHDSPSMLQAPKELLSALNIHVVGAASDRLEDEMIELRDKNGNIEAVIAAVPFLRDRDLRTSISYETMTDRTERIKQGIYTHYEKIATLCNNYAKITVENEKINSLRNNYANKIPIVAMGHLFATGSIASDKQDNIYVGNIENINGDEFSGVFDYVALGHIHYPQAVGGLEHVRYSGSLIPLSFSEIRDKKSVTIVEILTNEKNKKTVTPTILKLPTFRKLIKIEGDLEKVKSDLAKFAETQNEKNEARAWVELLILSDQLLPNIDPELRDFAKKMPLELLKIRVQATLDYQALDAALGEQYLEDLDPTEVFRRRCQAQGRPPEEMLALEEAFLELRQAMENG